MTIQEKRIIGRYVRTLWKDVRGIRFEPDGSVTCVIGVSPQRIFAGWDCDLLHEAKERKEL